LTNLTLQGGLASGGIYLFAQTQAPGGAILNQGTLSLDGVTIQNNTAQGWPGSQYSYGPTSGGPAAGGGVYSTGALTMLGCTIRNNSAVGGRGADSYQGYTIDPGLINIVRGGAGGSASGAGIYVAAGNASVVNSTFTGNSARGGDGGAAYGKRRNGGAGGAGLGGGLYVYGAGATLRNCTITSNSAIGGTAGGGAVNGQAIGGGIYIGTGSSVGLDAFTVKHTAQNKASTSDRNIAGTYDLLA
jgi:hypothetical protein